MSEDSNISDTTYERGPNMYKYIRKYSRKFTVTFTLIFLGFGVLLTGLCYFINNMLQDGTLMTVAYVADGICIFGMVVLIGYYLLRLDLVSIKKTIKMKGWSEKEIEEDLLSGRIEETIIIGHKYIAITSDGKSRLYLLDDIIWMYQNEETMNHYYWIFKTGETTLHCINIVLRNGEVRRIMEKTWADAQDIMEHIQRLQPYVIIGYSERLRDIYRQDFNQLIRMAKEKEVTTPGATGYYDGTQQSGDEWQDNEPSLKFPF